MPNKLVCLFKVQVERYNTSTIPFRRLFVFRYTFTNIQIQLGLENNKYFNFRHFHAFLCKRKCRFSLWNSYSSFCFTICHVSVSCWFLIFPVSKKIHHKHILILIFFQALWSFMLFCDDTICI
jgi:hypothetical protein